ncbi:hypothetical protein HanPSC8_Chr10g0413191 [Helianthus annuus]|nr:hypothetical protein HanPSC8_Chr10g0413191 [Helianthus annuus]
MLVNSTLAKNVMNPASFLSKIASLCITISSSSSVSMAIQDGYTCVHSLQLRHTYHHFNRFKLSRITTADLCFTIFLINGYESMVLGFFGFD